MPRPVPRTHDGSRGHTVQVIDEALTLGVTVKGGQAPRLDVPQVVNVQQRVVLAAVAAAHARLGAAG